MGLEKLFKITQGVIGGLLTNHLWQKLQAPGYGKIAFKIGERDDGQDLHMGYDDLAQVGIGTVVITEDKQVGAGFILGTLLTKYLEKKGYLD